MNRLGAEESGDVNTVTCDGNRGYRLVEIFCFFRGNIDRQRVRCYSYSAGQGEDLETRLFSRGKLPRRAGGSTRKSFLVLARGLNSGKRIVGEKKGKVDYWAQFV